MDKTGCTVGFQLQKFLFKMSISCHKKKSWKPQHNPAKLLVGHGFTLNYGVFHPQGIMLTHSNGTLRLKVQLNVSVEATQCACQHNNVALIEF